MTAAMLHLIVMGIILVIVGVLVSDSWVGVLVWVAGWTLLGLVLGSREGEE